jgi:transketolase
VTAGLDQRSPARHRILVRDWQLSDPMECAARDGHVLYDNDDTTTVSSGSGSVLITLEAASKCKVEGIDVRLVSLPWWLIFDKQDEQYKKLSVLRSGGSESNFICLMATVFLHTRSMRSPGASKLAYF